MVQMVVNDEVVLFSTDIRPCGVTEIGEALAVPGLCGCKAQDFACICGWRIGYHLVDPCAACREKAEDDHRWFVSARCAEAKQRLGSKGRPFIWTAHGPEEQAEVENEAPWLSEQLKFLEACTGQKEPLSDSNGRESFLSAFELKSTSPRQPMRLLLQETPKETPKLALQPAAALEKKATANDDEMAAELARLMAVIAAKEAEAAAAVAEAADMKLKLRASESKEAQERARVHVLQRDLEELQLEMSARIVAANTAEARRMQLRIEAIQAAAEVQQLDAAVARAEARAARSGRPEADALDLLSKKREALAKWQESLEGRAAALSEAEKLFDEKPKGTRQMRDCHASEAQVHSAFCSAVRAVSLAADFTALSLSVASSVAVSVVCPVLRGLLSFACSSYRALSSTQIQGVPVAPRDSRQLSDSSLLQLLTCPRRSHAPCQGPCCCNWKGR